MTLSDWSPLSGDPMATMSEDEWAEDMLAQLSRVPGVQAMRIVTEMTNDEWDIIRERLAKQERSA